jgi:hypothetical protein
MGANISRVVIPFPGGRGKKVQPVNQFLIFDLGAKVRAVTSLADDPTLSQAAGPLFALHKALSDLSEGKPFLLDYSTGGIKDAVASVRSVISSEYEDKEGKLDFAKDWNTKMYPWGLAGVRANLTRLEHLLAAEFEKTATYLVAKTTSFDTAILIETAVETLTSDVRAELSEMAIFDYNSAGRCLGFGLFTAAGFHVARATEAVMLSYCELFLGQPEEVHHTWGQMLSALEKCKTERKPDKSTLAILEQIKNVDRNDLMHPRKTLDLTEATRLFHLATAAIIAMTMEMRLKSGKGKQGELFSSKPLAALSPPTSGETSEQKKDVA